MHIAIIGCGQLARMMTLAGWRLGTSFSFYAEDGENTSCVNGLGTIVHANKSLQGQALYEALGKPDAITVEREHVDTDFLQSFEAFCSVFPSHEAVRTSQHRGREKRFLNELGIGTAPFKLVNSEAELRTAMADTPFPVILKSCEEGYDGRGQWKLNNQHDLETFLAEEGVNCELVIEGLVNFDKEVSLVCVRSSNGECAFYPLTENEHQNGILLSSIAPANVPSETVEANARAMAESILSKLNYVGVLSIEFFLVGNELLVNELAPRVHNSGHWTQAAGICSQFENHIRAISGISPGLTLPSAYTGMINLLGKRADIEELGKGNVQLHEYNKSLRPNRKVGHINVWNIDRDAVVHQLKALEQKIYQGE